MYKQICSLLLLMILASPFYSQNKLSNSPRDAGTPKIINTEGKTPFPYRHSIDRGLTDRIGNLWFATSDGVYRYDGKLFANYPVMDGLPVDHVTRMLEDKTGNIWFGALCGIVRCDPTAKLSSGAPSFTAIKIRGANGNGFLADIRGKDAPDAKSIVGQMMEDKNGAIWFSVGYNVYRTDGKSMAAITTSIGDFLKSEKVPYHCKYPDDFGINGIYQDKKGNILISTMACSCGPNVTYRLEGNRVDHPCMLNRCKHDMRNPQDHAAHDKEIASSFSKIANEDGKTNIVLTAVLEDRSGTVLVGTDSGMYKYDGTHLIHFTKGDMLSKSVISSIYEDKKGNIWFGTGENAHSGDNGFHGNGVFRYDPSVSTSSPSITQFTTQDGICNNGSFKDNTVSSIVEDNSGRVWFAGNGGACYFNGKGFTGLSKDGFTEDPVNCIVKDKFGNLWFGTWQLGLYRYDGKSLIYYTENKPGL